jgi:hypothetical protein
MATRTTRGRRGGSRRRGGARPAAKPAEPALAPEALATAESLAAIPLSIPLSTPEPAFAARVVPPQPERPRPTTRRAIFLDVENTSRPQHLAQVLDHLAVDHRDTTTELVAVANWKVVGQDSARLLARIGAQLVHSAPSTGVRDWSDLRIAVAAGIWLAAARPGDTMEIVSDDRAFDAVGDVAASLGIGFRRLSYRQLLKEDLLDIGRPEPVPSPHRDGRGRRPGRGHRRPGPPGGSRGGARDRGPGPGERPRHAAPPAAPAPAAEAHTAPHDEIVAIVRGLVEASPDRAVTLDLLANALKSRGFRRPPGSPRLGTRLRRIRELVLTPSGLIRLAEEIPAGVEPERAGEEPTFDEGEAEAEPVDAPAATDGGGSPDQPPPASRRRRRRRRRRRGGRRGPTESAPPA